MKDVASRIKKGNVVAFCGAGLSAESGIPTFRGRGGLWEKYDPQLYGSAEGLSTLLLSEHKNVRDFVTDFYSILLEAKPNYAHYALSQLEERGYLRGIITQNIDDFHFQAGSRNVAEIHGNAYVFRCEMCDFAVKKEKDQVNAFLKSLAALNEREDVVGEIFGFMGYCPHCHRRLEPGIVLFGQSLPLKEVEKCYEYLDNAEVVLCVGTSGTMYPAASFPLYAHQKGTEVIIVNPEDSFLDSISDCTFYQGACSFFKNLFLHL
ncbi:MAG: NAD-dependent protein deacylase [Candidatus Omnitrophota bacterium]|nr:MAG: NAD-dependent protein deacylase [Candidatus Omnitrophota bacterium]